MTNQQIIVQRATSPGWRLATPGRRLETAKSAFTLVELMVVVVILGVLATMVTVSVTDYLVKGKQSAAQAEISQLAGTLQLFYTEYDHYPDNDEGLQTLKKSTPSHPHGLIQGDLLDPWGHPYVYVYPGLDGPFDLCSYGANGREGGTGPDRDLCNNDGGKNNRS